MEVAAAKVERTKLRCPATLVAGLGSAHGDDQFGWLVAEHLASSSAGGRTVVRSARSPAELLDWLEGCERLIVADACQSLGSPGAIHCWHWPDAPLGALRAAGTHDLGLAAVLGLAEELRRLPAETWLWCVEIETPQPGAPVSPYIQAAALRAAWLIRHAIAGKPAGR